MFRKANINILLITLFSLIMGWQLFLPGYFSMHDDLQVMRLTQMDRCFQDGQIPCRWSPDMGAGYGQPMFNYYSVFPYYLGELIHLFGFSFVDVSKILFFLIILSSGIFSYLFFAELATPAAALFGSAVYIFAPYRAVDIFVRGALSEAAALALLPLVLLFITRIIKDQKLKNIIGLALSLAAFLLTHNITTLTSLLIFIPTTITILICYHKGIKSILNLVFGLLLGASLSAFFLLPVLFEKNLIQSDYLTQGYFNYNYHFASFKQLFFSLVWGYGPSDPSTTDNFSLAVGLIQSLSLVLYPIIFLIQKQKTKTYILGGVFWILALASVFMTHNQSAFVYQFISPLAFIQFPWRFLGLTSLCTAFVWLGIVEYLNEKNLQKIVVLLMFLLIVINLHTFHFDKYFPNLSDSNLLSGPEWERQQKSAILDYLPVTVKSAPSEIAPSQPMHSEASTEITYFSKRSNFFTAKIQIYSKDDTITFPIAYFPGWVIYSNNKPIPLAVNYDNNHGLISLKLEKGTHQIQAFFENTPIRQISNTISFVSLSLIVLIYVYSKQNNED